jgi:hypothetical protein
MYDIRPVTQEMLPRQPYRGPVRKLVLAFDVGTTYSAISYCILGPGEVPKIEPVTWSVFITQHTCSIVHHYEY